jgi:hypothetical protein
MIEFKNRLTGTLMAVAPEREAEYLAAGHTRVDPPAAAAPARQTAEEPAEEPTAKQTAEEPAEEPTTKQTAAKQTAAPAPKKKAAARK